MSETIRLIAEFFRGLCRNDCICTFVPGSAEILSVLRTGRGVRLDLLQADPSVYDRAGIDLFCNGACYHSVAQLRGIQALPGNGISYCRDFSVGAGRRNLLDGFLCGNK